jgi:nitrile hydratase
LIDTYEHGRPRNGARVVVSRGRSPYKQRLLANGTAAIAELGYSGEQGADLTVVENTPKVHNLHRLYACSCYPWPVLGLPPVWYKSAPYRSRAVIDPRGVLREFGTEIAGGHRGARLGQHGGGALPGSPERPAGTEKLNEEALAALAGACDDWRGKDCVARRPSMNGVHDMGGTQGMGPIRVEKNEPVFHAPWEARVIAMRR